MSDITTGIENLSVSDGGVVEQAGQPTSRGRHRRRDLHAFASLTPSYAQTPTEANGMFDPNAAASSAGISPPTRAEVSRQYTQNQYVPTEYPLTSYQTAIPGSSPVNGPHVPGASTISEIPTQLSKMAAAGVPAVTSTPALSVPLLRYSSDENFKSAPFLTFENVSPPPAGTQYNVVDQGNASPKFVRMSLYSVPATKALQESTGLPLGLLLRPFAPVPAREKIPEADFTAALGVPRCRRCRAYVNPAMQQTGYQMVCNLCGFTSPVPNDYTSTVDSGGVRSDFYQRPELHAGIYDIRVPKGYWLEESRAPEALHHVFLVDLSRSSTQSQMLNAACTAIRLALYSEDRQLPMGSKVALVGFDSSLRFFNLSPSHHQASFSVMSDLFDPFAPFSDEAGMFVDPVQSHDVIEATLSSLEQEDADAKIDDGPAFGAALNAADILLASHGGGQVTAFLSTVPSCGPGELRPKLPGGNPGADFASAVLTAKSSFYRDLANQYLKHHVGVNVFVGSPLPIDMINIEYLTCRTGGVTKYFPRFNIDRDELDLAQAVKASVCDVSGYEGQLKIRCSWGLQVSRIYHAMQAVDTGGAAQGAAATPVFPVVGPQTSVACDFVYDGNLNTKKDAHFQAAMLYTGSDGIRRVRVINCIMSVTERVADVFSFADQDTVLALTLRSCLAKLPDVSLITVRNLLATRTTEIVSRYAALVAKNTSLPGQLVLPQGLRTLPMLVLGALKSRALMSSTAAPDCRVDSLATLMTAPADQLSLAIYPVMYCLHRLEEGDAEYETTATATPSNGNSTTEAPTAHFNLPPCVPLSQSQLEAGGAYLIFNGKQMVMWLHSDVSSDFLHDLFGRNVDSLEMLDPNVAQLPLLDTGLSRQIRGLRDFIARHFIGVDDHSIQICRFRTDTNEREFLELLYEDRSAEMVWSYAEFLRYLHKNIDTEQQEPAKSGKRFGLF
ncbi:hypothetical protein FOA43_001309 [Brettanomyces nanus]|uniref:Uncharacterized protein n=1 Tax=Eeniella nana TaxID=13502 RepID=A0A875S1L7_EENNA|nr:uncharacterized protein FOA43_001309 [Brettanomyces nanus]QPG73992.1 hypothetical protein FOA43_001309 [Brettanomyces nanus]